MTSEIEQAILEVFEERRLVREEVLFNAVISKVGSVEKLMVLDEYQTARANMEGRIKYNGDFLYLG